MWWPRSRLEGYHRREVSFGHDRGLDVDLAMFAAQRVDMVGELRVRTQLGMPDGVRHGRDVEYQASRLHHHRYRTRRYPPPDAGTSASWPS